MSPHSRVIFRGGVSSNLFPRNMFCSFPLESRSNVYGEDNTLVNALVLPPVFRMQRKELGAEAATFTYIFITDVVPFVVVHSMPAIVGAAAVYYDTDIESHHEMMDISK